MRKRIIALMVLGSTLLVARPVWSAEPAESSSPVVASVTSEAAPTVSKTKQVSTTRRAYSYGRVRRSASRNSGGPTNYNYSGVGFPRMEGGLNAAANRTTWLKPMNTPRRRSK